jgi:dihydrofolate reductase
MEIVARPVIAFVVARADNGVIGRDNGLPWHLPEDLKHFKRLTVGKPIVMGRKTFESIGKPLPGRHNIVLTRDPEWRAEGVTVVPNLAEAIAAAGLDPRARAPEIMIVGGAHVYAEALPIATRVYLTEVHAAPGGDTILPAFDPAQWRETAREDHPAEDDRPAYSFVTLDRAG